MNIFFIILLGGFFLLSLYGLVYILNQKLLSGRFSHIGEAVIATILLYVIIVVMATYGDFQASRELSKFDLNGDGVFSGKEITLEQKIAFNKVIHDTGRSMAPITGIFTSILYFFGLMVFFLIYDTVKGIIFKK